MYRTCARDSHWVAAEFVKQSGLVDALLLLQDLSRHPRRAPPEEDTSMLQLPL